MYKQDYLEVFVNEGRRVTIKSGNDSAPDMVSIVRHDLRKLASVLIDLAEELDEEFGEE